MRIDCCYCGVRGNEEFAYLGDATVVRPHADPACRSTMPRAARGIDYVYLRDNPAGPHRELWQHVSGCRAWLVVTRDTRTHEILRSSPRAMSRSPAPARQTMRPRVTLASRAASPPRLRGGIGGGVHRPRRARIPPTPNPSPQGGGELRSVCRQAG